MQCDVEDDGRWRSGRRKSVKRGEELVRREISSVLEPFYALIKDMIFDDIAYYS